MNAIARSYRVVSQLVLLSVPNWCSIGRFDDVDDSSPCSAKLGRSCPFNNISSHRESTKRRPVIDRSVCFEGAEWSGHDAIPRMASRNIMRSQKSPSSIKKTSPVSSRRRGQNDSDGSDVWLSQYTVEGEHLASSEQSSKLDILTHS